VGGWGAILVYAGVEKELSGGERETTNNRMELLGAISALEALKEPCKVILTSDSKYLTDAFLQGWIESWRAKGWRRGKEELKNPDLWERLYNLTKIHEVEFVWVKGHAGHEYNERCDRLAVAFADSFS
jgi:ribonuclease HI